MRIGVLGGTFDPVHFGHLLLAEGAARAASLDRVLFMPAHIQPFKQDVRTAGDDARMEMLRLAIADDDRFGITDVELARGGVSYTIDSLRRLRGEGPGGPGDEWFFIVGADMFPNLEMWKERDRLLREFSFVVGRRPGCAEEQTEAAAERFRAAFGTEIIMADNTRAEISSSEIRRRVAAGESARGMTPDAVIACIAERGLYES
jgi:nicotinate-nucleotide adenylyltransferase